MGMAMRITPFQLNTECNTANATTEDPIRSLVRSLLHAPQHGESTGHSIVQRAIRSELVEEADLWGKDPMGTVGGLRGHIGQVSRRSGSTFAQDAQDTPSVDRRAQLS